MISETPAGWIYLDFPKLPRTLHAAGDIHGVAPNIVLRFPGTDHTGDHRAVIYPLG